MTPQTESFYEAMFRASNNYSIQDTEDGLMSLFNQESSARRPLPQRHRRQTH